MRRGIAAVLGGATGGLDELSTLRHVDGVFAVNDMAVDYPGRLAAFATLHPEKLPRWLADRRAGKLPEPDEIVAHEQHPHVTRVVDYRWPGMTASGSSGLFAVKVALETFDRVVLCGVPMNAERAHYFHSAPWRDVGSFRDAWITALPFLKNVRSLSGWTAELLGFPDHEFLHPAGGTPESRTARR